MAAWTALREQMRLLILTHRVLHLEDFRDLATEKHLQLVDALRKRNSEAAEHILRQHLAASFRETSNAIRAGEALLGDEGQLPESGNG